MSSWLPTLLRRLIESLVDALLRPVYCAWRQALRAGQPSAAVHYSRFLRLVDGPWTNFCRIEWTEGLTGRQFPLYISAFPDPFEEPYFGEESYT